MGRQRQSRTKRKDESDVRLQERDQWVLEAIAKCKFLSTRQLARLFFNHSTSATNKRLRKLLDGGLVKVWVRRLDEENLYTLTRTGAQASGITSASTPRGLEQADHVLLINSIRIEFSLGIEDLGGTLVGWQSDWELRAPAKSMVPDARFTVGWPSGEETTFFLEADNQSRSLRGFTRKCLRYIRGTRGTVVSPESIATILFVATDADWLERYRHAARAIRLTLRLWFTTLELLQQDFTGPIWRAVQNETNHSLQDLISQPYGKEGFMSGSSSFGEVRP